MIPCFRTSYSSNVVVGGGRVLVGGGRVLVGGGRVLVGGGRVLEGVEMVVDVGHNLEGFNQQNVKKS